MRDSVLWRKQSHIIMALAEILHIDAEQALDLFYSTETCRQFSDPKYGLQVMSDQYIIENILNEIQHDTSNDGLLYVAEDESPEYNNP